MGFWGPVTLQLQGLFTSHPGCFELRSGTGRDCHSRDRGGCCAGGRGSRQHSDSRGGVSGGLDPLPLPSQSQHPPGSRAGRVPPEPLGAPGRPLLSLPEPLAPAEPAASAGIPQPRGWEWVAGSSLPRDPPGAPSAAPCSAVASSARQRWRARAARWATRTARGAPRASRPAPPGPGAVPGSRGQVGAWGGTRGGWF